MAAAGDRTTWGRLPLFEGLSPGQLAEINAQLHRRTVPTGRLLMMVEDPGEVAYLILEGTVKVYVDRPDGTEIIIALRGPGEIVGEMSIVDRHSRSATVLTLEPCTLLAWDRARFAAALQTMPGLSYNLARILASRLRVATAQIQALAGLDLQGRVARQILTFAEEYGRPAGDGAVQIPLRLTQSDLAGMVGASRVRVNEVVVDFKRRGYIAVDARHRLTVHDAAALARRCQ